MATFTENIILVYDNRLENYKEVSNRVAAIYRKPNHYVIYYKRGNRPYRYSHKNVLTLQLKKQVDLKFRDLYIKKELQLTAQAVGDYGAFYAIKFSGSSTLTYVESKAVYITKSVQKTVLAYISEVAATIQYTNGDQQDEQIEATPSFLSSQIRKISILKGSVLASYLGKQKIIKNKIEAPLLYPFAVNRSQKSAIKKALQHNISIIQGPPGTGKTQSILNLIANLVTQGKTVGVVSNNNSAIENVKEKLEKAGYGFLIAHLGNSANKREFFDCKEHTLKISEKWKLSEVVAADFQKQLQKVDSTLDTLLEAKERLSKAKEELLNLNREYSSFNTLFSSSKLPLQYEKVLSWSSDKLIEFREILAHFPDRARIKDIASYLSFRFKYGKPFLLAKKAQGAELSLALIALTYKKREQELEVQIKESEKLLAAHDLNKLLYSHSQLSSALFKDRLYHRYSSKQEYDFSIDSYYKSDNFSKFVGRYPVILSTTHSILNSVPEPLDYIIVDESSQVDIITASLAFSACRNVVIVGDEQQLSHIVGNQIAESAEIIAKEYQIEPEYNYVNKNIIDSLTALYGKAIPRTLLREHYRCHPLIIGYCNRKFYQQRLIVMNDAPNKGFNRRNFPIKIFRTAPGIHGRNNINERQIAVIQDEILNELESAPAQVAIITPYRNQADKITQTICVESEMECDTIHKFQGREKERVIFSTVSNQITPFIDSAELINVAVSRAIKQFILVMPHSYELTHGSNLGDLIRYIEHWNPFGTVDSQIVSYFDLLWPHHSNKLNHFKKQIKGNSKYESENIIESLIKKILNESELYSSFYLKRGYPLYLITPNKQGLTEREIQFSNHRLAHVDFLIINRCDNSFVLAIEVDGYTFHSTAKQQERDAIKDKVLALNGVELLRLSTRGYGEEEKIREKLRTITLPTP